MDAGSAHRDSPTDSAPPPASAAAGVALVVDAQPVFHLGCTQLLRGMGFATVLSALTAAEAAPLARRRRPALIVLAEDALPEMAQAAGAARLLAFASSAEPAAAAAALRRGAHGVLARTADCAAIRAAVARLLAGGVHLDHEVATRIALMHAGREDDPLDRLTPRERRVLGLVADGADLRSVAAALGVSYKTAANLAWGVRKKLGARSAADLVRLALAAR